MPFEERKANALEAVRPRIEQFHAALTLTTNQVRGLLAGAGSTEEDKIEALGYFARGKMNKLTCLLSRKTASFVYDARGNNNLLYSKIRLREVQGSQQKSSTMTSI